MLTTIIFPYKLVSKDFTLFFEKYIMQIKMLYVKLHIIVAISIFIKTPPYYVREYNMECFTKKFILFYTFCLIEIKFFSFLMNIGYYPLEIMLLLLRDLLGLNHQHSRLFLRHS